MENRKITEPVEHYTHEADVFRTRVFGIQDGLISVGAIALGTAGYSHDPKLVVVTGLIATIAGAFSMGVGEYISTRVRNQIIENEIKKENWEIENFPEKEKEELKNFYVKKGLPEDEAEEISRRLMKNKNIVLQEMMIHELRLFPEEYEPPAKLGLIMASYLILGGLIPLIPFFITLFMNMPFNFASVLSVIFVIVTLGIFGAMTSKYTGLPRWRGAIEQISTGLLALAGSYIGGTLVSYFIPINSVSI